MQGVLYQYLSNDHRRLDALLEHALARAGTYDMQSYAGFRTGLLRHIAIEEKIVFPAIVRFQDGRPSPSTERLRLDHGALVSLLVPPPSRMIVNAIRAILHVHNALEEQEGGVYQQFERLAASETEQLLDQLVSAAEVPVLPHNDKPEILESTRRSLARAGYTLSDYET